LRAFSAPIIVYIVHVVKHGLCREGLEKQVFFPWLCKNFYQKKIAIISKSNAFFELFSLIYKGL